MYSKIDHKEKKKDKEAPYFSCQSETVYKFNVCGAKCLSHASYCQPDEYDRTYYFLNMNPHYLNINLWKLVLVLLSVNQSKHYLRGNHAHTFCLTCGFQFYQDWYKRWNIFDVNRWCTCRSSYIYQNFKQESLNDKLIIFW